MNYFGIGVWIYMVIGLIIGLRMVNDPDWQYAIDEYEEETRHPLVHLFRKPAFVIVLFVLVGVPIGIYMTFRPGEDDE